MQTPGTARGGVATRQSQPDDATSAYKRALELDRDLVEVHLNLGSLWLEQNNPGPRPHRIHGLRRAATNTTMRDCWLKLGMAQLRVGEIRQAGTAASSAVLALKAQNDPEAYNVAWDWQAYPC